MQKKKVDTYRANAMVNKDVWDRIVNVSDELALSPSSVVRMAIVKGLEQING